MAADTSLPMAIIGMITSFAAGGFLKQVWASMFGDKGKSEELDFAESQALQKLSAELREEIRTQNAALSSRIDKLVTAVSGLTDFLDDKWQKVIGDLSPEERIELRRLKNEAKRLS